MCMQYRLKSANDVTVPPISNTPGSFTGAQFELMKSLMEYAEIIVLDR